jgi:hypothetical protein
MISARLLAATVAALAAVAGFARTTGPESLNASPRRTYFGPNRHNRHNRHNRSLLAAFVAHHGQAEVASRADVKTSPCAPNLIATREGEQDAFQTTRGINAGRELLRREEATGCDELPIQTAIAEKLQAQV